LSVRSDRSAFTASALRKPGADRLNGIVRLRRLTDEFVQAGWDNHLRTSPVSSLQPYVIVGSDGPVGEVLMSFPHSISMVIHFICRGNTHRSRLAEAYARSSPAQIVDVTIVSSGIEADHDLNGHIVPFVTDILQTENLLDGTGTTWTQTTQPMIDASDVLIFMSDDVFDDARQRFQVPMARSLRWRIPDTQGVHGQIRLAVDSVLAQLEIVNSP
jgi:protein-tyrosine-phosphatase